MAYVAPSTVTTLQTYTSAAHNIIVNDIIDHEARIASTTASIKRLGFVTRTTNYSVASSTVAGAANIFSSSITFTADGTSAYRVEFYCPQPQSGASAGYTVQANLVDGSGNDLGRLGDTPVGSAGGGGQCTMYAVYFYTPAAGSTTINARGVFSGGAGNFICGAGGSGNRMPMFLAVYGPPTT